jgi:hypothetical protein
MNNVPIEPNRAALLQVNLVVGQQHFDDLLASIPACGHEWRHNLSIVFEEFLQKLREIVSLS